MTEPTPSDRLQPTLFDRFTLEGRVLTKIELHAAVRRDLTSLMNAVRLGASEDLSAYPEVERSVLNYGMPAFAGEIASTLDMHGLEASIRNAILRFEPRILAESLLVEAIDNGNVLGSHNVVCVKISAQIWAQPVPLELLLRTEVDLETGQVALAEVLR
ncbi:type VI secretion system baseplate subunit TssE [Zoogloea sp.]|uniref:type VI secretion system baseplate subunit TssE n=1 Tax=Zoogloea sp. TaxID=49181 RepID=UPI0035B025D4